MSAPTVETSSVQKLVERLNAEYAFEVDYIGADLGGFSSQNNQLTLKDKRRMVLKRCDQSQWDPRNVDIAAILAPHSSLIHAPLATVGGSSTFKLDGWVYAVFPYVDGEKLHQHSLDAETLRSAARALYAFHHIAHFAETHAAQRPNVSDFEQEATSVLEPTLTLSGDHADIITRSIAAKRHILHSFSSDLSSISAGASSVIHGDFHNENILYRSDHVVAVLDFEMLHWGNVEDDIISFIALGCCNNGFSEENLRMANIFVEEYSNLHAEKLDLHTALLRFIHLKSSSLFLQKMLIHTGNMLYAQIIERDAELFPFVMKKHWEISKTLSSF